MIKNKQKSAYFKIFPAILLAVLVLGIGLMFPSAVNAARTSSNTVIEITEATPASPKMGEKIKICFSNSRLTSSTGYDALLYVNGKDLPGGNLTGTGQIDCFEPIVNSQNNFKVDSNTYYIQMDSSCSINESGGRVCIEWYSADKSLIVQAAPAEGQLSLVLRGGNVSPGSTLKGFFDFQYTPGPVVSKFSYDCGKDNAGKDVGKGDLALTAKSFQCSFPNYSRTYSVTIVAYNQSGSAVKNASVSLDPSKAVGTTGGLETGSNNAWGPIISLINIVIGTIIAIVRWVVWAIGVGIILPLLDKILQFNASDIANGVVLVGWTFVRDVTNMFFILALIIIGFGTMLRLESYNYKKLLVNLIMMALLVNFSLVIGRIIIQMADVVQFSFLPAGDLPGQPSGTTAVKFIFNSLSTAHVGNILDGFRSVSLSGSEALASTFFLIFQFIFELGVVITFAALGIFMIIRTIALWILLILSPFAYGLSILPATADMAKKWWSNFIKYVLFAPIIAFFLRLTLELYRNGLQIFAENVGWGSRADLLTELKKLNGAGSVDFGQAIELGMIYVVVLAFLWAGMIVTKNMGIAGAGAIVGLAEKGMKAPLAAGQWMGKEAGKAAWRYAATKYDEKTLGLASGGKVAKTAYALLHPLKFRKAMKQDSEKDRERAKELGEAAALKVKRQTPLFKREGKDPMFHALMEHGEEELKERFGAYSGNESEEVKRTATLEDAARNKGDKRAARMLIAQTLRNAKGKHINQVLYEKGLAYNHPNLTAYFNDLQEKGVFSESVNEELQTQLSETGYAIGDSTLTELSDGGKPLEIEETENSGKAKEIFYNPKTGKKEERVLKEYRYKGTKEFLEAMEEARRDGVTEDKFEEEVEKRALVKGLKEEEIKNARRAFINIRNRNINVSKVDKFNLFHNSLFTTKINDRGVVEVVLGDGGDQAFLNIQGGDIWRASRNGIPDKSKEWINKMIAEGADAGESVKFVREKLSRDYNQWLTARGEFKDKTTFNKEIEEKVENFAKMIYASKFNKGVDQIEIDLKNSGKTTSAEKAEYLVDHFRTGDRPLTPGSRPTTP